jgi:hypothetical protein
VATPINNTSLTFLRGIWFSSEGPSLDKQDMVAMDVPDEVPCIDWLLSSPVAMFILKLDLDYQHKMSHCDDPVSRKPPPRPTRPRRALEVQLPRRPSISSESSAPGMEGDVESPSATSYEGGDCDSYAPDTTMWDSWFGYSLDDLPSHVDEKENRRLRTQHSNFSLPRVNFATSSLTKMRSVGDLHTSYATQSLHDSACPAGNTCRTCLLPPGSLQISTRQERDTQPLHDYATSSQSTLRPPSSLRTCTTLEPCSPRTAWSNSTSPYPVSPTSEWYSHGAPPLASPFMGEKSVFEDWDEPKTAFWNLNRKRKRRWNTENGNDVTKDNKSPRRRGKLWNLGLLSMPGVL